MTPCRGGGDLAAELCADGQWAAGRREALRALADDPADTRALLLASVATLRLDPSAPEPLATLSHLSAEAGAPDERAGAAYELGRARWSRGDLPAAWSAYALAFQAAQARDLFLRSGCALFLLRGERGDLGRDDPALLQQLASCRDLWNWELRKEVRVAPGSAGGAAVWLVGLYRAQIRPAIAHRCSLQPSCSEYFLQASRRHGWMGLSLIGDRLVREPDVVASAAQPVRVGELILYRDPLEDHESWITNHP